MAHNKLNRTAAVAFAIAGALYAPHGHSQERAVFENKGGLNYQTADGNFSFEVFGRVQADTAFYDEDVASLGSGTSFRRVRIGAQGTFYEDWGFKSEFDFANEGVALADVFIQYLGFDPIVITAGHFKQPFSLSNITSTNDITFMERALTHDAFVPGRRIGAGVGAGGDNYSVNVGVFGETASGDAGEDDDGNEFDSGFSAAARATFAPIVTDTRVLHVGGSVYWRDPSQGEDTRFRTRPESNVTDVRLVDTDVLAGVDDVKTYGLEAAGVLGPFHAQGEYMLADVSSALADADFDGWYVEGGYFLTGESRPYAADEGRWKRVTPEGPAGAWQVALRYSTLDLTDGGIDGGEEDNVGVALNWYPNYYLRFSANYIDVLDHEQVGVSDEPSIFQLRAQVVF
ncbi:MAG: OprO/OprP family phosphate-selective porin [Gammaproteobacteria bacterium]